MLIKAAAATWRLSPRDDASFQPVPPLCVCVCVCFSHMPLSPAADTKHDRPRQQAVTNGNPTGSAVARDDDADDTPSGNSIVVRIGIPDLQQTVTHT